MGRRAKKAPVVTKKRPKLSKNFKCPFCANQDTVECKMDFRAGIGSLSCRLCSAAFQMPIHHLHEPVDVFSEWLDECEAAQNPGAHQQQQYAEDDDDDDDDIPESSGLGTKSSKKPAAASANYSEDIVDVGDSEDDDDDE